MHSLTPLADLEFEFAEVDAGVKNSIVLLKISAIKERNPPKKSTEDYFKIGGVYKALHFSL
jgi:hypothetical protein